MSTKHAQIKTITLSTLLLGIAGISMGNQSCQQAPTRQLKMEVALGPLGAMSMPLPTGEVLDFPTAVNTLYYSEVMNSDYFSIAGSLPTVTTPATGGQPVTTMAMVNRSAASTSPSAPMASAATASAGLALSANDLAVMQTHGFKQASTISASAASSGPAMKSMGSVVAMNLPPADPDSLVPTCEYAVPIAKLGGQVLEFAAVDGAGISLGFSPTATMGIPITNVGAAVNFTSSQMTMEMNWTDNLENTLVATAPGVSYQDSTKFSINLSAVVTLGLNFFYTTPLATTIKGGIDAAMEQVVTNYIKAQGGTAWNDVWESRVLYDPTVANGATEIIFWGGTIAGMQVGDTFTVTNMNYTWIGGTTCNNNLNYRVPAAAPVATVKIVALGDHVSVAQVTPLTQDRILPGAQVKILALSTGATPTPSPTPAP